MTTELGEIIDETKSAPRCANSRGHDTEGVASMPKKSTTLCACGCGEPAPIVKKTERARGYIAGQPRKFIHGHNHRKSGLAWIEDPETGCWVWQRSLDGGGYGITYRPGRRHLRAHRVAYEEHVGPIPEGMEIDHLCRNRACVNPAHLEPVTKEENVRRGLRAKLDPAKVREIRRRLGAGATQRELASEFGVTRQCISDVARGRRWGTVR